MSGNLPVPFTFSQSRQTSQTSADIIPIEGSRKPLRPHGHSGTTGPVSVRRTHKVGISVDMADPTSPPQRESSTTREEIDFDDTEQETGNVLSTGQNAPAKKPQPSPARKSVSFHEPVPEPPAKPPRPLSDQEQAENTLIEAFPSIDTKVVKAVLVASGGKVEPAFNALLGMSDPDFQPEVAPPPQPPRPNRRAPQNQLEADELYARQVADQYGGRGAQTRYNQRAPDRRGPNQQRVSYSSNDSEERNFFDDDLPEIGRNIQQGFLETQKRVNSWITNFKKKIDGDDEEDAYSSASGSRPNVAPWQGRQDFGSSRTGQSGARQREGQGRRSTEVNRYDADPQEFDEHEFERLELRDDEAPAAVPPRTSSRKAPNPDLFKAQPKPPQSGPVDEVEAAERRASASNAAESDKNKKWQPLTSVAPTPAEDNDPFSLGDDDEEKEKGEELRQEDSERLKENARKSVSSGTGAALQLSESATSGTKDKTAEELLAGKE